MNDETTAAVTEALTDKLLDTLEARLGSASFDRLQAIVENPGLTDDDVARTRRDDMRAALAPLLAAVITPLVDAAAADARADGRRAALGDVVALLIEEARWLNNERVVTWERVPQIVAQVELEHRAALAPHAAATQDAEVGGQDG